MCFGASALLLLADAVPSTAARSTRSDD
jgi:hypothetical protein